jgi:orotate phosphoribosyltransferase
MRPMDRETLGRRIAERCRLEGEFRLRSGQTACVYFDLFEADPCCCGRRRARLSSGSAGHRGAGRTRAWWRTRRHHAVDPYGLPAAFVRKEAKSYGTMKLAEGADVGGRQVLIVEDVITTGGQVLLSAAALRERGANVVGVLCVIDRREGRSALDEAGMAVRALFRSCELPS